MIKAFIIIRVLDILTTLYGVSLGRHELNPFNRWLLSLDNLYFIIFQLLLIYAVFFMYKRSKLMKVAVGIFTYINLFVVLINITLILLVLLKI